MQSRYLYSAGVCVCVHVCVSLCVCACVCVCVQGSQAQALTFTLHHLRTGVPSRGHLHIFERQIEKKEKGGNLMGERREGGEKEEGGGERDRWREKG